MRIIVALFGSVILPMMTECASIIPEGSENTSRITLSLNEGWSFLLRDVPGEKRGLNDSAWETIDVPHTWNTDDFLDDEYGYYRGIGWYRKEIVLPEYLIGKRLFLYFNGVNQVCDVYVNEQHIGRHVGGYSAFCFDVTDAMRFDGKKNLISIKVDNRWNEDVPPIALVNFVMYGGIYRNTFLIATDPVHVSVTDYAGPGVYIDTPGVSEGQPKVRVRGKINNDSEISHQVRVVHSIKDSSGRVIQSIDKILHVPSEETVKFDVLSDCIDTMKFWSPENPVLYSVETKLWLGNRLVDVVENKFGFRYFSFDPNKGFFLNGKHRWLKGTNRHQDRDGYGNALPDAMHQKDLEIIKDMGCDFLRLAHYPQDPVVLDTADKIGLLIWEEIPVVTRVTPSDQFRNISLEMINEMILQHYNHPSVILWGVMNEPLLRNVDGVKGDFSEAYIKWMIRLCKDLNERVHELDPGRCSVMAIHASPMYAKYNMLDIPDVLAWNRYDGWYGGAIDNFGNGLRYQHKMFPNLIQLVSEYGAASDSRLITANPLRMDFSVQYQQKFLEGYFRQFKNLEFLAGAAVWSQFDFGNPNNQDALPALNTKGLLTFDRHYKDVYYLFQANYSVDPVVYIATREWANRTAIVDNTRVNTSIHEVKVYSNGKDVKLVVNGQSYEKESTDSACVAKWEVPLKVGDNEIDAIIEKDGRQYRDKTQIRVVHVPVNLSGPGYDFKEIAVNVGSHMEFYDASGTIWLADREYTVGGWGHVGGTPRDLGNGSRTSRNIIGTEDDPLYQSYLIGLNAYKFDVPDGFYTIELRLTDYETYNIGERIISIDINRKRVTHYLDLVKQYGNKHAASLKYDVHITDGQGITIGFKPIRDVGVLCGVKVTRHYK